MTLISLIIFVLIFSFLVIIHELGHFWAAKKAGVRVDEFGLGLPPRIWGKRRGDTIFSLNAIPFGGFVKLKGEGGDHASAADSMPNVSYGWRLLIITGGVLMNLLSAYVLICIGMWLGMPPLATDPARVVTDPAQLDSRVIVVSVQEDMPAQAAGIQSGDVLISANGVEISRVEELQSAIDGLQEVVVVVQRGADEVSVSSSIVQVYGKPVLGIAADEIVSRVDYVWWRVPAIALQDFANIVAQIGKAIWVFVGQIFVSGTVSQDVAGPVGIAKITAQAVSMGLIPVLQLMIFLSINLGLLNLFPFPALDGGRLVFLLVEMISGGRKVSPVIENVIHNLGFILLLMLIAVVTYRDVLKLF